MVAEFYIEDDKKLFHALLAHKEAIESSCGLSFDWRELPERKASRIVVQRSVDLDDKSTWGEQFDWIVDVLLSRRKVFCKYL